ncbi:CDP-alcohol phosphatidyltransferase family protein [Palleronia sediminis]|uniref:CDP-alcohol phosphatidyltransferase family protein n=2 Tax=Palleronia sediminis TaxID=2547833 RepID=A0A4R6AIX9_9RHOB|nr:CDP-alcohol phosphatidyltransferase family protein [Palleronia sediminis]
MISAFAADRNAPARLIVSGAVLALPALLLAWALAPRGVAITVLVLAGGIALASRAMIRSYPHERLGGANLITTSRLALTAAISAAILAPAGRPGWVDWAVVGLAAFALCLDGLDGWLARRQGLSSGFGARYDLEVDSALAAVLAAILWAHREAGVELIVLGAARYVFVAARQVWPWLGAPLFDSMRRKTVCVIQIAALVALTVPVFPDGLVRPVAIAAAALVLWSFAIDIRWLAKRG